MIFVFILSVAIAPLRNTEQEPILFFYSLMIGSPGYVIGKLQANSYLCVYV
jgi:hypothetical protein